MVMLRSETYDHGASEKPLTSHDGYADTIAVAKNLVEAFCSLPWSYQVAIRAPDALRNAISRDAGSFELSPRHRLIMGSTLAGSHPLRDLSRYGLAHWMTNPPISSGWDEDAVYLQVDVDGYYTAWPTEPSLIAREEIFSFFGLGIALGLFTRAYAGVLGSYQRDTSLYVHMFRAGSWHEHRTEYLDDNHKNGIGALAVSEDIHTDPARIRQKLDRISSVYRAASGKNILLSSRWLLDSHCGRDELLSYVQAAVSIEILLGDEEADHSVGLTTLMANRCAYLIANSPESRVSLLRDFREIYKVRSKIVHRGKSRLSESEVRLFHVLQAIIRAVIDKEQRLLFREV